MMGCGVSNGRSSGGLVSDAAPLPTRPDSNSSSRGELVRTCSVQQQDGDMDPQYRGKLSTCSSAVFSADSEAVKL